MDIEKIPEGFGIEDSRPGVLTVHYKRTGMGCMNLFLIVWLIGWSIGTAFLIGYWITGEPDANGNSVPFFMVAIFTGCWFIVFGLLQVMMFKKRRYNFHSTHLDLESRVHFYRKNLSIQKRSITEIRQTIDGGHGKDSFPRWGLIIKAENKEHKILGSQTFDKSEWLGNLISGWCGVPYISSASEAEKMSFDLNNLLRRSG